MPDRQFCPGFCYRLPPIDFWLGWATVATMFEDPDPLVPDPEDSDQTDLVRRVILHAKIQILRRTSWQGDLRDPERLFPIPVADPECPLGVCLKQDNNGTTFIWSPVALPWLKACQTEKSA